MFFLTKVDIFYVFSHTPVTFFTPKMHTVCFADPRRGRFAFWV